MQHVSLAGARFPFAKVSGEWCGMQGGKKKRLWSLKIPPPTTPRTKVLFYPAEPRIPVCRPRVNQWATVSAIVVPRDSYETDGNERLCRESG